MVYILGNDDHQHVSGPLVVLYANIEIWRYRQKRNIVPRCTK